MFHFQCSEIQIVARVRHHQEVFSLGIFNNHSGESGAFGWCEGPGYDEGVGRRESSLDFDMSVEAL